MKRLLLLMFFLVVACSEEPNANDTESGINTQNTIMDLSLSDDMTPVSMDMDDDILDMTSPRDARLSTTDMQAVDMQAVDMQVLDMQVLDMQAEDAMLEIDAALPTPPSNCFPAAMNDNLAADSFYLGPHTNGTELCHEDDARTLDNQGAGLGYFGEESIFINQHEVSGCLVADFGNQCLLDEHVGVGISMRAVAEACQEDTMNQNVGQCDVEAICGTRPGASALLFAASDLNDPRFISRVGSCGDGYFFSTLTPIQSFAEVNALESVRYLLVCRPKQNCGAEQADVSIDALYLIWRQ